MMKVVTERGGARRAGSERARRDFAEQALRASLSAGALLDVFFGVGALVALRSVAELLRAPMPQEPFYPRLAGFLLVLLAGFYAIAAERPAERLRMVFWAAVGRLAGAGLLAGSALGGSAPRAFLVLGAADLLLGLLHGGLGLVVQGRRNS